MLLCHRQTTKIILQKSNKLLSINKYKIGSFFKQSENSNHNRSYYQILGIPKTATDKQIRKVFLQKARQIHPDHNTKQSAQKQFTLLKQAYEVLKDPQRRYMYDTGISSSDDRNGDNNMDAASSASYYGGGSAQPKHYYQNKWYNFKKNEYADQRHDYYQQQQQYYQARMGTQTSSYYCKKGGLCYRIGGIALLGAGYWGYDWLRSIQTKGDIQRQHAKHILQGQQDYQTDNQKQKNKQDRKVKIMQRYIENRAKQHIISQ